MGRAAEIAFTRDTDVISYYSTEEHDAREVTDMVKAEGRKAIPIPGDLRGESDCKESVARALCDGL
jgi:hypothetical protein